MQVSFSSIYDHLFLKKRTVIHEFIFILQWRVAKRGERTDGEKDCTCAYCIGEDSINNSLNSARGRTWKRKSRRRYVSRFSHFLLSFSIFLIRPTTQITHLFLKQLEFPIIPNNNIISSFFGISRLCNPQLCSH